MIKGFTLDGAGEGIKEYIAHIDADKLNDMNMWNAAVGQMFFSLSVCMGEMTAYSSYTEPKFSVATDEKVVAFCDVGVAFMSGFVVYSVLGYMEANYPLAEGSHYQTAGFGLVFKLYPTALGTMGGGNFFGILFFFSLFLLGIDSAFSMVEAVSTVIHDFDFMKSKGYSRQQVSGGVCVVGFILSLIYTADTGFYYLDIVDK